MALQDLTQTIVDARIGGSLVTEYKVNDSCIIGLPACGYGFASSRTCFIARPADGEFQLEEDILRQLLTERNYETYVALQHVDPGNFVFCTKICSKIITSQFCIALLNASRHVANPDIKIANPNVHLEYGMMLSFHKHVIPMQRKSETLPFNIYPLDTVKYRPENFRERAEQSIDGAILRFSTNELAGRSVGPASDALRYFSFRGLRYTDVTTEDARAIFQLGSIHGFYLFDGADAIVYFGYFPDVDFREITVRTRFLLQNIGLSYDRILANPDNPQGVAARRILDQLEIEVLVPEDTPIDRMEAKLRDFQPEHRKIGLAIRRLSDIERVVEEEYAKMEL